MKNNSNLFRLFVVSLYLFITSASYAQTKPKLIDSGAIISKGIELHDEEKYDQAIEKFIQVHPLDTNYMLAQYELSHTLLTQKKYQEAIDLSLKLINMNTDQAMQYNILGTSYDNMKEYDKALSAYDEGIKRFPYNDNLIFNRSVVFEVKEDIKSSVASHIKHLEQNPFYPSTHLRLGVLMAKEGFYAQSMLCFATFLMLEPSSGRSFTVLGLFEEMSDVSIDDVGSVNTEGLINEFEDIDFLIKNKVALNKKYKTPSEFQFSLVKQLYLVSEKLNEQKSELGDGFWARFYAPFYIELYNNKNNFNYFSMLISASSTNEKVQKVVKKNLEKIKQTITETRVSWKRLHDDFEIELAGKMQKVKQWYNVKNQITAIGKENENKKNTGDYIFVGERGNVNVYANFNDGKKEGKWIYFYVSGDTLKVINYSNDKTNGPYRNYYSSGRIRESGHYKDGEYDGIIRLYYANGMLKDEYMFKDAKLHGKITEYYKFGAIKASYDYESGELNGEVVQYHANEKEKFRANFVNGKREGKSIEYYDNGQEQSIAIYLNNELEGDFIRYYQNGKINREGKLSKGTTVGEWKYYDYSGVLTEVKVWDDNGKENGDAKSYTLDGKVYSEELFAKGELKNLKYYNPDGSLFKEFKFNKGTGNATYYNQNLDIVSEGKYINTQNDGVWKFYVQSGALKTLANYKLNVLNGEYFRYFANGNIDFKLNYKNGEADGFFEEYYNNNATYKLGNYVNGEKWGEWTDYYKDGKIRNQYYYSKDEVLENINYAVNGKPTLKHVYDDDFEIEKTIIYDTTGIAIDSLIYPAGKYEMVRIGQSGKPYLNAVVYGSTYHGQAKWLFPNGKNYVTGEFINNSKNGPWTWYHPNGKILTKGSYHVGEQIGVWQNFDIFGIKVNEREYDYDKLTGKNIRYDEDGKLESVSNYRNGDKHGEFSFFAPNGELKIVRYYNLGKLVGYAYQDSQKKIKEMIPIKNETAEIKAYYPNGKVSVEYKITNGDFNGKFIHYYPSGKLLKEKEYLHDNEIGEAKDYYENGQLKLLTEYLNGQRNGTETAYYEDGKVKYRLQYLNGKQHGNAEYFDKNGKKIYSFVYYDGEVVSL